MSKPSSHSNAGWTPLYDPIVAKFGLITASIYGIIWRYSQMKDGVCRASIQHIANQLHVSRVTVIRSTRRLLKAGFIIDRTPQLRNRPHIYIVARGKLDEFPSTSCVKFSQENQFSESGVSESDAAVSESDSTITESHSGSTRESLPAVAERYLSETLLINKEETEMKRLPQLDSKVKKEEAILLWEQIQGLLITQIPRVFFETWVKPTRVISFDGEILTIGIINSYGRDLLEARIQSPVTKTLQGLIGDRQARVEFVILDYQLNRL